MSSFHRIMKTKVRAFVCTQARASVPRRTSYGERENALLCRLLAYLPGVDLPTLSLLCYLHFHLSGAQRQGRARTLSQGKWNCRFSLPSPFNRFISALDDKNCQVTRLYHLSIAPFVHCLTRLCIQWWLCATGRSHGFLIL